MPKYITRKELADLLECSTSFIAKNEKKLGLDACRCDLTGREARYFRQAAFSALLFRGLIEPN